MGLFLTFGELNTKYNTTLDYLKYYGLWQQLQKWKKEIQTVSCKLEHVKNLFITKIPSKQKKSIFI
jgi:hypothetical protein